MITSTGHYIFGSITETGRFVVNNLTETGESTGVDISTPLSLTGSVGLSYDVTGTLAVSNHITGVVGIRLGSAGDNLLSCSVGIGLSASGSLSMAKVLSGSAGISLNVSGSLSTPNLLSGSAGIGLRVSGQFDKGVVITGVAGISLGVSGNISVPNRLTATAGVGLSVSGSMSAPVLLSGSVGISLDAGGSLTIPLVITGSVGVTLDAHGTLWVSEDILGDVGEVVADAVTAWVMNTATGGHAEYTNYPFNSFLKRGSDYYGCNSDGIYKLTGKTDAGQQIKWSVKTGITTFGMRNRKYVPDARLVMRADGDVSLRTIVDEQIDRSNMLAPCDDRNGLHARRIKLAKGLRGTSWQFEVSGEEAADISGFEVEPLESART